MTFNEWKDKYQRLNGRMEGMETSAARQAFADGVEEGIRREREKAASKKPMGLITNEKKDENNE